MLTRGLFIYILLALCVTPPSLIASPTPGSDVESPENPAHAATTPVTPTSPSSAGHPTPAADSPALNGTTAAHSSASPAASPAQTPKDASPSASAPARVTSSTNTTVTDSSSKAPATDGTAAAHPPVSADPSGAAAKPQGTNTTVASRPPTSESAGSAPNTVVAHLPASADSTAVTSKSQVTNVTAASAAPSSKPQGTNDTAHSDGGHAEPKAPVAPGDKGSAASHAAAPAAPAVPTCFTTSNSKNVESHHCDKALEKVLYAANQTLDKFSSLLFVNYKTCNINLLKPHNATVNKLQLFSMVHNITEACSSQGGAYSPLPKISVRVERGTKENTYEVDRPVCKREKCPLTWSDCLSAFHQIPEDPKGFVASKNATRPSARVTSGNCTVTLATTDHSAFSISRQYFYPTIKKLLNECGNHPGKIYQEGGALGYNGDVKISVRPANKELCN